MEQIKNFFLNVLSYVGPILFIVIVFDYVVLGVDPTGFNIFLVIMSYLMDIKYNKNE
jgi:hypothetical protein